jgi:hypothetical protein
MPAVHVVRDLLSDSYTVLYVGRWIARHGIPHREVFTAAAHGRRWIDQQWLAELGFYEAWALGGYALVAAAAAGLVALTSGLLAGLIRRRGGSVVISISFSSLAIAIALPYVFVRAQDTALPLLAALLILCLTDAEHARPQRRLVLLIPLLVLWANLHGSVLVGATIACGYLLYRALLSAGRRDWGTTVTCVFLASLVVLSPLATPYGTAVLSYYHEIIGNGAIRDLVPEWRSPTFLSFAFLALALLLGLVALLLVTSLVRRRRPSPVLLAAVVITAALAAITTREIVWFSMTACVILAEMTQSFMPTREVTGPFLVLASGAAAACTVVAAVLLVGRSNAKYEELTPLHALAATEAYAAVHPCAQILADNTASSALLWHDPFLAGRVAFDARLEQYPARALIRWGQFQIAQGPNWRHSIGGYQILVGSTAYNADLTTRLAHLRNFRVLTHDAHGIAVARLPPATCRRAQHPR